MTFYMFRLIILLRIDCINTTCTLVDPSENLGPLHLVFPLIGFSIVENHSDVCFRLTMKALQCIVRFWFFSLNIFGKWPLSYIIRYVELRRDDANSGCGNLDLEHGHHHCLEQVEHDGFQKNS